MTFHISFIPPLFIEHLLCVILVAGDMGAEKAKTVELVPLVPVG